VVGGREVCHAAEGGAVARLGATEGSEENAAPRSVWKTGACLGGEVKVCLGGEDGRGAADFRAGEKVGWASL
jgi:hypothetical protein